MVTKPPYNTPGGYASQPYKQNGRPPRGVTGVQVDVAAGRVTVESDQPVPADAVAAAVDEAGYEVVPA